MLDHSLPYVIWSNMKGLAYSILSQYLAGILFSSHVCEKPCVQRGHFITFPSCSH